MPTPAAAGGPPPSSTGQSAIFDGGRSLGLESFQNRGYLDNLTQWRLETRIHNFTNGSVLSTGGYTISISPAPNPILYFTDYNLDRGVPYVCYVPMSGVPNDITLRIERRNGLRFIQVWDQQRAAYPPSLCWDSSNIGNETVQLPRLTNDRLWAGRIGSDIYNNDRFNGRIAWVRIFSTAANSTSLPPSAFSTANLLFAAEFKGNLTDSGPNILAISSTATPFTFFAGTP